MVKSLPGSFFTNVGYYKCTDVIEMANAKETAYSKQGIISQIRNLIKLTGKLEPNILKANTEIKQPGHLDRDSSKSD
jgi:hypothetical protein